MTQGEFMERLLDVDRIISEQDIRDFVSEQSKGKKIPSLLALVKQECGWLFRIKESKFGEVEKYRQGQRNRVSYLMTCIKQQTNYKPRMLPDFLTDKGMSAFNMSIKYGLIDKDSFEWIKPFSALSNWVHDMCLIGGCNTPMGMGKEVDWVSFENYFGVKKLRKKWDSSQHHHSCPSYDKYKVKIFPELGSNEWGVSK